MGLQIRHRPQVKARVLATFIAALALVAQPMYGVLSNYVANALTSDVTSISMSSDSWSVDKNTRSTKISVTTNGEVQAGPDSLELDLSSSSSTGRFATTSTGSFSTTNSDTMTFTKGHATTSFYYKDSTAGTPDITARLLKGASMGSLTTSHALTIIDPTPTVPTTLYVSQSGDDSNNCSQATPCATLQHAVDVATTPGETINIISNLDVTHQVNVNKSVVINGSDKTLTAKSGSYDLSTVLNVTGANVTINGLTVDANNLTHNAINAYSQTATNEISLNNVTVENGAYYGLEVNGSNTTVDTFTTKNNKYAGAEVGQGSGVTSPSTLTVNGTSSHTESGADIYIDDATKKSESVNDMASQYYIADNGNGRAYALKPAAPARNTVTVKPGDKNWTTDDTRTNGHVNFITDSSAGTDGNGALSLKTDNVPKDSGTDKAQYMNYESSPLALSSVTGELSYYTKQNSTSPDSADPAYQIPVYLQDSNGDNKFVTLTYEPYLDKGTSAIHNGNWQKWTIDRGTSKFYVSHSVSNANGGVIDGQGNHLYTLDQINALFPHAQVLGFGANIGSNNPGYNTEVDDFTFNNTTYNFEPNVPADTTAPVATFDTTKGSAFTTNSDYTVTGKYKDAGGSGISRIQLYASKGDGYNYNTHAGRITATLSGDADSGTWTAKFTAAQLKSLGVSTNEHVTFTAVPIDKANNGSTTRDNLTLVVDNSAPTVVFSSPSGEYQNSAKPFIISGTYTEHGDSGINRVQLYVSKGGAYDYNTHVGYLTANLLGKPASADGATGTFTYTLSQSEVDQLGSKLGVSSGNQFTITAVAIDNLGNGQVTSNNWKNSSITLIADNAAPTAKVTSATQSSKDVLSFNGYVNDQNFNRYYCYLTTNSTVTVNGHIYTPGQEVSNTRGTNCLSTRAPSHSANGNSSSLTDQGSGTSGKPVKLGDFDIAGLPSGDYTVNLVAEDLAGNSMANNPATFVAAVDHTPPVGSIGTIGGVAYSPNGTTVKLTNGKLFVSGTVKDDTAMNRVGVQLIKPGVSGDIQFVYANGNHMYGQTGEINWSAEFDNAQVSQLKDGQYSINLSYVDKVGNVTTNQVTFTLDNTPPALEFTSPNTFASYYSTAPTVSVHGSDPNNGLSAITINVYDASNDTLLGAPMCSANATEIANGDLSCDLSGLPEGHYYVEAVENDTAKNNRTVTSPTFIVDNTDPVITSSKLSNNPINKVDNNLTTLTTVLTDAHSNVASAQYRILDANGNKIKDYGWVSLAATNGTAFGSTLVDTSNTIDVSSLSEGSYIVRVRAFDGAGNKKSGVDVTFAIDNVAPSAPTISPASGDVKGQQVFTITPSETGGSMTATVNGSAVTLTKNSTDGTYSFSVDTNAMNKGTKINVTATESDAAGNASGPTTATVTVSNYPTPTTTGLGYAVNNNTGNYTLTGGSTNGAGATVTVTRNGAVIGSTRVATDGSWSVSLGNLLANKSYDYNVIIEQGQGLGYTTAQSYTVSTYPVRTSTYRTKAATPPPFIGVATPVSTSAFTPQSKTTDASQVLGDATTKPDKSVLGDSTVLSPSSHGWNILGFAWYWWLLLIAAVVGLWLLLASRKRSEERA